MHDRNEKFSLEQPPAFLLCFAMALRQFCIGIARHAQSHRSFSIKCNSSSNCTNRDLLLPYRVQS